MVSSSSSPNKSKKEKIRLVQEALYAEEPQGWRSAWRLNHLMEDDDPVVKEISDEILSVWPSKKDGHQRELLKLLLNVNLNDEQEGRLADICISAWEKEKNSPSLRVTALKHLLKLIQKYPEIRSEFNFLFEERYLESLSPGIKRSALRMINSNQ